VILFAGVAAIAMTPACSSCGKGSARAVEDAAPPDAAVATVGSATAPGAPKPGMVWIPAGVLKAGTPIDQTPRVAEEELPGTEIPMAGFYMDLLPYPNEAGAIPQTNVSRDDAARLCTAKGKRLCTELEWERACKGPDNHRYEYGDAYKAQQCNTGVPAEQSAKRPSGDRLACASGFGVRDMHGSVWQWTDSAWGRGVGKDFGVLRGGNAVAGEIAGRCANALGRPPSTQSPTMGFRCCAGPRNEAIVDLAVKVGSPLSRIENVQELPQSVLDLPCPSPDADAGACVYPRGWIWRPSGNVDIYLRSGCTGSGLGLRCGMVAATILGEKMVVLAHANVGREIPEVVLVAGEGRNARARGGDVHGPVFRELVYSYGKVDVRGKEPDFGR
jgi:formylglycine-generating enzyme required for sulfatase activity